MPSASLESLVETALVDLLILAMPGGLDVRTQAEAEKTDTFRGVVVKATRTGDAPTHNPSSGPSYQLEVSLTLRSLAQNEDADLAEAWAIMGSPASWTATLDEGDLPASLDELPELAILEDAPTKVELEDDGRKERTISFKVSAAAASA